MYKRMILLVNKSLKNNFISKMINEWINEQLKEWLSNWKKKQF